MAQGYGKGQLLRGKVRGRIFIYPFTISMVDDKIPGLRVRVGQRSLVFDLSVIVSA